MTPKRELDLNKSGLNNEKAILKLIKDAGPLSQSQICLITGVQSSTISYIVTRLREKNLIIEEQGASKKRGAKPILLEINPLGRFIAAVEISPSNLFIGLFDLKCQLMDKVKIFLNSDHSIDNVVSLLEISLKGVLAKHDVQEDKLLAIGITLSGSISDKGVVEIASPLGWKKVHLKERVAEKFNCPIQLYTTKVRLFSEMNDPDMVSKNIIYLNIANGVGITVAVDGRLIHGATDRTGELGHIIMEPNGGWL